MCFNLVRTKVTSHLYHRGSTLIEATLDSQYQWDWDKMIWLKDAEVQATYYQKFRACGTLKA